MSQYDVIIVGAGLFGITTALRLTKKKLRVLVIDEKEDLLTGASFINQNRVHSGFHYPRSVQTAYESLDSYNSFTAAFGHSLRSFENYYGVVREGTETTAEEYDEFLQRLQKEKKLQYRRVSEHPSFLRPGHLSALYQAYEPVIDIGVLRSMLKNEVSRAERLTIRLGVRARKLEGNGPFVVLTTAGELTAPVLINCAYGNLNWHNHPQAPRMQVQLVEMVKIHCAEVIPGITLMDGPFCSILPFGFAQTTYWFYSVNYSVHARAESSGSIVYYDTFYSNWERMWAQADKYFTFMDKVSKLESHYTPRTFVADPEVERTKARPSMIYELEPNFYQVLGGKLVTCVSVAEELERRVTGSSKA